MKQSLSKHAVLLLFVLACFVAALLNACEKDKPIMLLGGGHADSTFLSFATEFGSLLDQEIPELQVKVKETAGSLDNLVRVDQGKLDLALVNAEDAYLGTAGFFRGDKPATDRVQALVRLYGTSAQLVVLENSPYRTLDDLRKHRVAVGGSRKTGAALAAERFFDSLKMWDDIVPIYVNYSMGLRELAAGTVDAVWILGAFPNEAIRRANQKTPIRLLELWTFAVRSNFFRDYPFYRFVQIPAGTYERQGEDIFTFQSPTLLVSNQSLDAELAYRVLKILFSEKGLAHMRARVPIARELNVGRGLEGGRIPFHPGAVRFLREAL